MPAPLGNANATKSRRMLGDALKRLLTQSPEKVEAVAQKTIDAAIAGEPWAQALIYERVDGKMPQAIVGDDDEPAVKFSRVIRQIIDPAKSATDAQPEPPNG